MRKIVATIVQLVGLSCMTGCVSLPPLWPMSAAETSIPGYPPLFQDEAPTCEHGLPTNLRPTDATLLFCAQKETSDTFHFFTTRQRVIAATKNAEVLSLFGLGTAAGVNLATSGSKAALLSLGLAAASIVGLSTALGMDAQHEIYGDGAIAVSCLVQVDAALDKASQSVAPPVPDQRRPGFTELKAPGGLGGAARRATLAIDLEALLEAQYELQPQLESLSPIVSTLAFNAMSFIQAGATTDNRLKTDLLLATDPGNRALVVISALNQIKQGVADRLYKNSDVTKVYDAAKLGIQNLAKDIVADQRALRMEVEAAASSSSLVLASIHTARSTDSPANRLRNALAAIQEDANGAQVLTDAYERCVGLAPPEPSAPR